MSNRKIYSFKSEVETISHKGDLSRAEVQSNFSGVSSIIVIKLN
jgi:hypothetical protein